MHLVQIKGYYLRGGWNSCQIGNVEGMEVDVYPNRSISRDVGEHNRADSDWICGGAVSYTHLTLPTIYSV